MANNKTPHGSVMVVGSGISGMQAALDLADSGYLVTSLKKKPPLAGSRSEERRVGKECSEPFMNRGWTHS